MTAHHNDWDTSGQRRKAAVASPFEVLELDTHSSSKADPSEFTTSFASRSSSPTTSILEIPAAPIPPAPSVVVATSTDIISHVDAPPVTTIADSSAPSIFVYPLLAKTPRYNEAYRCWRFTSLSTMYPPTTSESSTGDSSFESSAGPSRKRCRSCTATVTSSIYALRALVLSCVDLLPPHRDVKDRVDACIGMEVDVRVDVEDGVKSCDRGTMKVIVDVVAKIYIPDGMLMPDVVERLEQVEEVVQDIYRHVMEIPLQRIMTITRSEMTLKAIKELINQRVAEALAASEANRAAELAVESQSQNGDDDDNGNVGGNENGNGEGNGDGNSGGNRNRNGGCNGNRKPIRNDRGVMHVAGECTYHEFVKYQPLNLKGTEGVVGLTRWVKKMETIFHIINCPERFQELTMMCTNMVLEEEDRVEKFIKGLPDNTQGNKDNHVQQPPYKRLNIGGQGVARAYTVGSNEKKGYAGPLPYCNKCKLHHEGPCTVKCGKCNKVGHMTRDCMKDVATTTTQRAPVINQRVPTCFEYGRQGHYRNECPKLKNQTRGNKAGKKTDEVRGKAYVSSTFNALLDVTPSTLDVSYAVELADGRISETHTVLRGCTLGLLSHPFNIDLMLVELGSFDVIIGMDWLANHHVVIVCDEKIVRIPYGDEVLIVQVMKKGTKDKSEEKRLEDVPIMRDFLEVFLEDLPGLPSTRQVEF
nr:hypothetical protein [Tanacetum cinerariifolium]